MTIKETYKYLEAVKKIDNEIRKQTMKHDALQSCLLPKAINYDKDSVQVSPEDKMSEIASEVLDIEKKLRSLVEKKARLIGEISDMIELLDNSAEQVILYGFYIGGLTIPALADAAHYSERSVYRLKRRGVKKLSEKMSVYVRS